MWPVLTALAVLVALALHFWWRRRLLRVQSRFDSEVQSLRERLDLEVAEHVNRQRAVFNSMVEGLLLIDGQGVIQFANSAFIRLFRIERPVVGQTLIEVLRRHELADFAESLATGQEVTNLKLQLSGPGEGWLEVSATTFGESHPSGRGTILVFHDLTRIKQLERTREEFVANVSHELRTPLSLVKGYVETLLDGAYANPEVATRFLKTIYRNAERLEFLINDLLTISELESGRVSMNLQPVALQPLVDKVLEDYREQAEGRGTLLRNEVGELWACADAERLQQVLGNLVSNAVKYGGDHGVVRVGAGIQNDQFVEVWVADSGPGIPPAALDRVFERFYRVDKARSREQGGTGLGLAIVKHIVQSHGGTAWGTSEPGKGACFHFTLPREPMGSHLNI